jgi:hypothetical protein
MAVRDRVKKHVVKLTSDMYQQVLNELNTVRKLLDALKRNPEWSDTLPPRVGQAAAAKHLSHRLELTWSELLRVQVRLPCLNMTGHDCCHCQPSCVHLHPTFHSYLSRR